MGRRGYPAEFRRRVLDLVTAGRRVRDVAVDLGISDQTAILEEAMAKTCSRVMSLEIPSEHANAGYFLFFGTSRSPRNYRSPTRPSASGGLGSSLGHCRAPR